MSSRWISRKRCSDSPRSRVVRSKPMPQLYRCARARRPLSCSSTCSCFRPRPHAFWPMTACCLGQHEWRGDAHLPPTCGCVERVARYVGRHNLPGRLGNLAHGTPGQRVRRTTGPRSVPSPAVRNVGRCGGRGGGLAGRAGFAGQLVSWATMAALSIHTCSRQMRPSRKSKTWRMRKVIRRLFPGMPRISPVTVPVIDCSRIIESPEK